MDSTGNPKSVPPMTMTPEQLSDFKAGCAQIAIRAIQSGIRTLQAQSTGRFDNADKQDGWDSALDAAQRLCLGLADAIHEGPIQ